MRQPKNTPTMVAKMTQKRLPATKGPARETAWRGEVARWYDSLVGERGSTFQQEVIFPNTMRLLTLRKGESLLDLACGEGAFSRAAHKLGAQVTGLDASEDLIDAARRKSGRGVRYLVGDAARLTETLPAGSFDAVVCILAVQNIDPVEPVIQGCGQVLRPGGRLVLVMTHPCFRMPRQSAWGWDEERKIQYRRVDRYLSPLRIPIQTRPGADPELRTWTFHRPLQTYFTALSHAGVMVDTLEEWPSHRVSQPGPRARAENRARDEIPLFLALRAVRIQS